MSFARFSSEDFTSDVYAYVDAAYNLITVHIATSRHDFDRSTLPEITADPIAEPQPHSEQWLHRHQALMEAIRSAKTIQYSDEYAGRSYYNLTRAQAIELLDKLEQRGYHIPAGTQEAIAEEPDIPDFDSNPHQQTVTPEEKNMLGFAEET